MTLYTIEFVDYEDFAVGGVFSSKANAVAALTAKGYVWEVSSWGGCWEKPGATFSGHIRTYQLDEAHIEGYGHGV